MGWIVALIALVWVLPSANEEVPLQKISSAKWLVALQTIVPIECKGPSYLQSLGTFDLPSLTFKYHLFFLTMKKKPPPQLPQMKFSGSFVIIFNPLLHSFNMLSHTNLLVNPSSQSTHSYLGPSCVFSVWFTGPLFLLSPCWQIQHSNETPLCFTNICLSKFDFFANSN